MSQRILLTEDDSFLRDGLTEMLTKSGYTVTSAKTAAEAIGNVIKDACEHTGENGLISVNITEEERSTAVMISDNGGGVKEDELPRLFERFHRSENAAPGTAGIGLAITKAVIEKHHGTVSAENTVSVYCSEV